VTEVTEFSDLPPLPLFPPVKFSWLSFEFDSLVNSRTASWESARAFHRCIIALMPGSAWAFTTGGGFHLL